LGEGADVPSDSSNFVLGVCTRTQGPSSFIEVRAHSIDGTINDISSSSHNIFGNNGEIEVRSARPVLKVGDWVLARPMLEGPPKRQRHVASSGRRLLQFEDLSGLYAPEAARRLLVETGRQDGFHGDKAFRIGASDVIEVRMVVSSDGRSRIGRPDDLTALPVWPYQPERRLRVPTSTGFIDLYERDFGAVQSGIVNWCSDIDFVRHVIGSFANDQAYDGVLKQAAALLSRRAELLESKLSEADRLDPRIGQEIIRSRKMADLLKSRDDMLNDFMNALRSDPEVKALIAERIEWLAKEAAAVRTEALVGEGMASLQADLREQEVRRYAELEETLRDLEATEFASMTARLKSAEEAALAGAFQKKTELESQIGALTKKHAEMAVQSQANDISLAEGRMRLKDLEAELESRKEEIDRIVRMESLLQGIGLARVDDSAPRVPGFRSRVQLAKPIAIRELASWVKASNFLSENGKSQCVRALADLIAAGLPVLSGDSVDDFIAVLAAAVGGGMFVSFDCDPTVITFDDLWIRPGGGSATALGQALADCEEQGATRFCVIRNVDRAAAHLWLDTLAGKVRRREVSSNMLICLTLDGAPGEVLEQHLARLPSIDTSGSMEKAAAIAAFSAQSDDNFERQVDLTTIEHTSSSAMIEVTAKLMLKDVNVSFADAEWFGRVVGVAKSLLEEKADDFILAAARRRLPASNGRTHGNGKSGLRVIESGGSSNA
jgi:hypothetical protein